MKFGKLLLITLISFCFSNANNLESFYRLLDESDVVRLKIKFIQKQFDRNFESYGDFYILGSAQYFYDSFDFQIYVNSSYITTKNHLNRQIILNNLDSGQLNLFDILSGNKDHINFSNENSTLYKFEFSITAMDYHGYFLFESDSKLLKKIHLQAGLNQSIEINVTEIETLNDYSPKIDLEDFEVIDLRG